MVNKIVIYKSYWNASESYIGQIFPQYQRAYGPAVNHSMVARWLAIEALNTSRSSLHVSNPSLNYLGFVLRVAPLVNGQPIDVISVRAASPSYFSLLRLRRDLAKLTYDNKVRLLAKYIDREVLAFEGKLLTREGLTLLPYFKNQNPYIDDYYIVAIFLVFSGDKPERDEEKKVKKKVKTSLKKPFGFFKPEKKYYLIVSSVAILTFFGIILLYKSYLIYIIN